MGHMLCYVDKVIKGIKELWSTNSESWMNRTSGEAIALLNLPNATHISYSLDQYAQCVFDTLEVSAYIFHLMLNLNSTFLALESNLVRRASNG